jgi:lipopolysaccharide/colanic/teichoic acid biosynthesis glycosyltransferase
MEPSYSGVLDGRNVRVPTPVTRRARRGEIADPGRVQERVRQVEVSREPAVDSSTDLDLIPNSRSERLNRAVNLTLGFVGLMILAPLFLVIAVAIKLSSRGPIFYTQTRVGLDRRWRRTLAMHDRRLQDLGGAAFTIFKFRTMYADAESKTGAVWATANDPRVTPLGRFLRTFRIDEFPQLINVVKGDMNLVGPRPERPSIFARLRDDINEYSLRQRVKPGLTGLAQINQKYDSCLQDVRSKVKYDLEYLRRQSLAEDLKIIAKTIPAVIMKTRGW